MNRTPHVWKKYAILWPYIFQTMNVYRRCRCIVEPTSQVDWPTVSRLLCSLADLHRTRSGANFLSSSRDRCFASQRPHVVSPLVRPRRHRERLKLSGKSPFGPGTASASSYQVHSHRAAAAACTPNAWAGIAASPVTAAKGSITGGTHQCDVPSDRVILLNTLYLPTGLRMGRRLTSLKVAAS